MCANFFNGILRRERCRKTWLYKKCPWTKNPTFASEELEDPKNVKELLRLVAVDEMLRISSSGSGVTSNMHIILIKILSPVGTVFSRLIGSR
jgi:hypothetical protein